LHNEPITQSRRCLFSYKTDSLLPKIVCSFRLFFWSHCDSNGTYQTGCDLFIVPCDWHWL